MRGKPYEPIQERVEEVHVYMDGADMNDYPIEGNPPLERKAMLR